MNKENEQTKSGGASGFFTAVFKGTATFLYKYRQVFIKLLIALLTLAVSTIIVFFLLRLMPGDPVREYALTLMGQRNISYEEAYRLATSQLNYDPNENVFAAFFKYAGAIFRGDFGRSIRVAEVSTVSIIAERLPWTLLISSIALLLSFTIGTWLGAKMAKKRSGALDGVGTTYIVVSSSVPDYLIGLLLVSLFAFRLQWFPEMGNYDAFECTPGFNLKFIGSVLYYAFLPITAYTISQTGVWMIMMRSSTVGVLGEDYVTAAKARGLSPGTISGRYLKRNAMLPLITGVAGSFAALFGGSPLMENIFNYPGIGQALSEAINTKDWFIVQGILLFSSIVIILVNLLVDYVYPLFDPRVKRQ